MILCLEGLSEVESFIMNDIIRAIQLKSLPFEDELIDLLDNY